MRLVNLQRHYKLLMHKHGLCFASLIWIIFSFYVIVLSPQGILCRPDITTNELGDTLAGFFAPLAVLWVIFGYLQANKSLELQRQELITTRQELAESVKAQNKMVEETKQQNIEQVIFRLEDDLYRTLLQLSEIILIEKKAGGQDSFYSLTRRCWATIENINAQEDLKEHRDRIWDQLKSQQDLITYYRKQLMQLKHLVENLSKENIQFYDNKYSSMGLYKLAEYFERYYPTHF